MIRKFMCNILDWHKPSYFVVQGINTISYCRYCDRKIMRDSQGNWFSIAHKKNKNR